MSFDRVELAALRLTRAVKALRSENRFSEALELLLEKSELVNMNPALLVEKGQLIQLDEKNVGNFQLADVLECYGRALEIDPIHVPAMLEIGWFCLNVDGNPEKALEHFERGLEILAPGSAGFGGAVAGKVYCLGELNDRNVATKFLEETLGLSAEEREEILFGLETYT